MSKFTKVIVPSLLMLGIGSTFLREMIVAFFFGSSREVESFRIAFAIPYALFQSLGSVLVAGLLPLLLQNKGPDISALARQLYWFTGLLLFVAFLTVPFQANILAPGFNEEEYSLLKRDMYLCWCILFFSALIIPHRLLLQAHDRVVLVSSTSLVFSVFFSIALFLLVQFPGALISRLSISSILSIFVVYLLFRFSTLNQERRVADGNSSKYEKLHVYKILAGGVIYVFLIAAPRLLDRAVASMYEEGVIANIDYAMNFYVAFGVLIGTSYVTIMARRIATSHVGGNSVYWYVKLLLFPFLLAVFIAIILMVYSAELVSIAYDRGAFQAESVIQTSEILYWFAFSLPVMVTGMVAAQLLMAGNVVALVMIAVAKVCVKGGAILWMGTNSLNVFGISTLIMELTGLVLMLVYFFWSRDFLNVRHD